MAAKKKTGKKVPAVSPDFLDRQRESLRRTHRQVIYLNDYELAAVKEYCRQFKISVSTGAQEEDLFGDF